MPRFVGIDYGERRIGLAVSDPTGAIAQPLPTLVRRRGKRPPVAALVRILHEHEAAAAVIGLPLTSEGEESEWTDQVRRFGQRVSETAGVPVHYIDERMTSARARRAIGELGLPRGERQRKERVDAAAAVLILQAWLDARRT